VAIMLGSPLRRVLGCLRNRASDRADIMPHILGHDGLALVEPETAMTKKLRAVWEAFTENVRKVEVGGVP